MRRPAAVIDLKYLVGRLVGHGRLYLSDPAHLSLTLPSCWFLVRRIPASQHLLLLVYCSIHFSRQHCYTARWSQPPSSTGRTAATTPLFGLNFSQHVNNPPRYRDLEPYGWRILRIVRFFLQTMDIVGLLLYHWRWGLCILCLLLIGALISSYYLQVKRIRAVHETVVSIFAGMVVGLIIRLSPGHMIREMMVC